MVGITCSFARTGLETAVGGVMTVSPPEVLVVAALYSRIAARTASRRRSEKVSKEIKNRSTSEGSEPRLRVGTGNRNWCLVIQNDKHAELRSACFHCGVTPRPLASRPRGHQSHAEAKSVPMRANQMLFLSTCADFVLRLACFRNASRWVFIGFFFHESAKFGLLFVA